MPDSEENQTCRPYQITIQGHLDAEWLGQIESKDNLFPDVDPQYWK